MEDLLLKSLVEDDPEDITDGEGGDELLTPEDDALDAFMDAHKRGDKKSAREALKSAIKLCLYESDEDGA